MPLPFNPLWINPFFPKELIPPKKRQDRFNIWLILGIIIIVAAAKKS